MNQLKKRNNRPEVKKQKQRTAQRKAHERKLKRLAEYDEQDKKKSFMEKIMAGLKGKDNPFVATNPERIKRTAFKERIGIRSGKTYWRLVKKQRRELKALNENLS